MPSLPFPLPSPPPPHTAPTGAQPHSLMPSASLSSASCFLSRSTDVQSLSACSVLASRCSVASLGSRSAFLRRLPSSLTRLGGGGKRVQGGERTRGEENGKGSGEGRGPEGSLQPARTAQLIHQAVKGRERSQRTRARGRLSRDGPMHGGQTHREYSEENPWVRKTCPVYLFHSILGRPCQDPCQASLPDALPPWCPLTCCMMLDRCLWLSASGPVSRTLAASPHARRLAIPGQCVDARPFGMRHAIL